MNIKTGVVYFLTNRAMPGLLKIGFTLDSIERRIEQLNTTGVPEPFTIVATFFVTDPERCEKELHKTLRISRSNRHREFFKLEPGKALELCASVLSKYLVKCRCASDLDSPKKLPVDEEDVYFLRFILHDSDQYNRPIATDELAEYSNAHSALELERKLIRLVELGLIERVKRASTAKSFWRMTPEGIDFMFRENHVFSELIEEARRPKEKLDRLRMLRGKRS